MTELLIAFLAGAVVGYLLRCLIASSKSGKPLSTTLVGKEIEGGGGPGEER